MFCRLPKKKMINNPSIQCHSDANFYNETFILDPNGQQIFIMCESKTTIVPVTKFKVAGSKSKVHYRRPERVVWKKWPSSIHSKLILKLRITTADAV